MCICNSCQNYLILRIITHSDILVTGDEHEGGPFLSRSKSIFKKTFGSNKSYITLPYVNITVNSHQIHITRHLQPLIQTSQVLLRSIPTSRVYRNTVNNTRNQFTFCFWSPNFKGSNCINYAHNLRHSISRNFYQTTTSQDKYGNKM